MVDFEWLYPVGIAVVIAFFLVRGISASIDLKHKIIGEMEPKHSPPLHERFATKAELKQTNRQLDKLSDEIRTSFVSLEEAGQKSRAVMYDKIQKTAEEVSAVRTQSDLTYQQLVRMEGKLDKLSKTK